MGDPELTYSHLLKLCQMVTDESDLRDLALHLGIEQDKVHSHLMNNRPDVTSVAYDMLNDWYVKQHSKRVAY